LQTLLKNLSTFNKSKSLIKDDWGFLRDWPKEEGINNPFFDKNFDLSGVETYSMGSDHHRVDDVTKFFDRPYM
jgi:hypothetical protein